MIITLIYVDDIIMTGCGATVIQSLISALNRHFALKDLGPLSYFLGIEVTRSDQTLYFCDQKYITDFLKRFDMWDSKPHSTPMSSGPTISLYDGDALSDALSVVGALQYCTPTRTEIAYLVNKVC